LNLHEINEILKYRFFIFFCLRSDDVFPREFLNCMGCHGVMEAEVFYRDQELRRVAMYQSDWMGSVGFLMENVRLMNFCERSVIGTFEN